jgi:hypothetical protein
MQNRNNITKPTSWPVGNITYGQVRELLPFPNPLFYIEIQGSFLMAAIEHNASQLLSANFFVISGLENYGYTLKSGGELPSVAGELTMADISAGGVVPSKGAVRWGGEAVDPTAWYPCVLDIYLLDTVLLQLPEREHGVRARSPLKMNFCEVVTAYLERGGVFGSTE